MKLLHISLLLLCSLVLVPVSQAAAVAPFQPMSSAALKIQGSFNSGLHNPDDGDRMSGANAHMVEGGFDSFSGEYLTLASVRVAVSGIDTNDAIRLKGFSGFPGFFPGVSPTDDYYKLATPMTLSAPNIIYMPVGTAGNQVRYVLTGYTGTGQITDGVAAASPAMLTAVTLNLPKDSTSTITWNYVKEVRVSVKVVTDDSTPLTYVDSSGDTVAGSYIVSNLSANMAAIVAGMKVFGNGIPEGTTVASVNIAGNTVTLSNKATQTFNTLAGQWLSFAGTAVANTADPKECASNNPTTCAAGTGATASGIHYYPASDMTSVVLTAKQSFTDTKARSLTQVLTTPPSGVRLSVPPRETLALFGLKAPLEAVWNYSQSIEFKVGQPMKPTQQLASNCAAAKPAITILAGAPTTPGDTVDSSFVWAWDNTDVNNQQYRYFPIHPSSFTVTWPITCKDINGNVVSQSTLDETGVAVWPNLLDLLQPLQKHIAGVPVNLQPPGVSNTFNAISYTTSGATTAEGEFTTASAGMTVLRFNTPPAFPHLDMKGTSFIVVQSIDKPASDKITSESLDIGKKITNSDHTDPEKATRTGYLFEYKMTGANGNPYVCGVYDATIYDRKTRRGSIIAVNESSLVGNCPLEVAWYKLGVGGIGWPTTVTGYNAVWPTAPRKIAIGDGTTKISEISSTMAQAQVYNQPNSEQPGMNPNEEHALLVSDTLYVLRKDLNSIESKSKPYVLVKYIDTSVGETKFAVYDVLSPKLSYYYDVGEDVKPPFPPPLQAPLPPVSRVKVEAGKEVGGEWHLLDHKGGHWAKAANWKTGVSKPDNEKSRFVMQWYYYLDQSFYWPNVPGKFSSKHEGDVVPYLNSRGAGSEYKENDEPLDITYYTKWPETTPTLNVGSTLVRASDKLPDLYNFKSAEVIFDENVYNGGGPLAKLYAPERYLYVPLDKLPPGINTEVGTGGVSVFPDLPYAIQARLFYDPLNNLLGFKGAWVANNGEKEWLLSNLMTRDEKQFIQKLATTDAEWQQVIEDLYTKARDPNGVAAGLATTAANPYKPSDTSGSWKNKWGINLGLSYKYIGVGRTVPVSEGPKVGMVVTADAAVIPANTTVDSVDAINHTVKLTKKALLTADGINATFSNGLITVTLKGASSVGSDVFTLSTEIGSNTSISGEANALTAGMAQNGGYVVVVENNLDSLLDATVALHVIEVVSSPVHQGEIKVLKSKNVFDEKLTLHYTGDFGGEPENFRFEWYYKPTSINLPTRPAPGPANNNDPLAVDNKNWFSAPVYKGNGLTDVTISGASLQTLTDNWFVARYYYGGAWPAPISTTPVAKGGTPAGDTVDWSAWSDPMLAVGWIKRVVEGLNPLDARVTDFRKNATNTTVSMLSQFGTRYEGDVAMNSDADNLNNMGLISAYQTVLNRGRMFSIDSGNPQDYGPANDALLNVTSRLATFYLALGNEAYADAVDPTIGFGTKSREYGNMAPSVFSFQNQVDSLLEEELALLRGRDDSSSSVRKEPHYNRLLWNFTQGEGEVAYVQNYNITDQIVEKETDNGLPNGMINEGDAKVMYPQGHGDAWGHYLTAINYYYKLLGHPYFSWMPRVEFVLVAGNPTMVDYLDERKFASLAAARAKTGAEILELTYRKFYTDKPEGQWQGYKDNVSDEQGLRAWGVDDWARRAGQAAYFDWLAANAMLPADALQCTDGKGNKVACDRIQYVEKGKLLDPPKILAGSSLQLIDRARVPELQTIASQFHKIQAKMIEVDGGVNPIGLVSGVVPFDIDPVTLDPSMGIYSKTHFEQIYDRAEKAVANAVAAYDYANGYTQRLRQNQDTLEDFKKNLTDQERDYTNRLIEIFGTPYLDDIGPGKLYKDGYLGPDFIHYMYVDRTELTGDFATDYTYKTTSVPNPIELNKLIGYDSINESTASVTFAIDKNHQWITKPKEWTSSRRSPGRIQQALSDFIVASASFDKAYKQYKSKLSLIDTAVEDLRWRYGVLSKQIQIKDSVFGVQLTLDAFITANHASGIIAKRFSSVLKDATDAAIESVPKVVGTATDITSPARGSIKAVAGLGYSIAAVAGDINDFTEFSLGIMKGQAGAIGQLQLDKLDANWEVSQMIRNLQNMTNDVEQQLKEALLQKETVQQALRNYQAVLAEGSRLWDERTEKRTQSAAEVQDYRYQDLGFRVFRNDAIQKYRAQFDLAAKYVYLAAAAYDYETNLLGNASGAGGKFLSEIVRQRSLGVLVDGVPQAGFPGLTDTMARLSQNFSLYKTQLGFNNPQTETTPFSLRTELFRIRTAETAAAATTLTTAGYDEEARKKKIDDAVAEANSAWKDVLKNHKVDDLWKIPEFKRYCRPFAPESAGPQPGIVIKFPTTITYGKNFFGWPLSGGDSAYSTSNFSTKVRSVGLWFQNYNNAGLSSTPRVYLVPTGADVLRSPTGDGFKTRDWLVRDQKLPAPFPIGDSDLKNPDYIPANDSLSDEFAGIRKLSDFRAYPYSGSFDPGQTATDSRLIGRSVWNTQWMLIIPGSTLLFNKDAGLNTFIDSVDDIKMFFQTYAYSGN